MTNQEKHLEENKEHSKISEDSILYLFRILQKKIAYILFFFQRHFTYPLSIL